MIAGPNPTVASQEKRECSKERSLLLCWKTAVNRVSECGTVQNSRAVERYCSEKVINKWLLQKIFGTLFLSVLKMMSCQEVGSEVKRLNYDFKNACLYAVKTGVKALALQGGADSNTAALLGEGVSSLLSGFSFEKASTESNIYDAIEGAFEKVLESGEYGIPFETQSRLKTSVFTKKAIVDFICQPNSKSKMQTMLLDSCGMDRAFDTRTFPLGEFVDQFYEYLREAAGKKTDLADYLTLHTVTNLLEQKKVFTANEQYARSFTEPLFLHKDDPDSKVTLENLYVLSDFTKTENGNLINVEQNLEEFIIGFINDPNETVLFIEGDAGCGKTSLVAWMNHHYSRNDEICDKIFDERPLITIRLRDLDKEKVKNNLASAIRDYMNIENLDELERQFQKAVMVLDGFDELCMIEGINESHEKLLDDWFNKGLSGYKFIVTTRPGFIKEEIRTANQKITLQHFNSDLRKKWLDRYCSPDYCGQHLDEELKNYIETIEDGSVSSVCDTPMTLYMIAAKRDSRKYINNPWELYHHIFSVSLSETEYNKMFPNADREYKHAVSAISDELYRVSEEIAYYMYQRNNSVLYLNEETLEEIITKLTEECPRLANVNVKDLISRCYTLCGYWKQNSDKGAVEFLHNNIRDFFLAEKICRESDALAEKREREGESFDQMFAESYLTLFHYGTIDEVVCRFIYYRSLHNKEAQVKDFAKIAYQCGYVSSIVDGTTLMDTEKASSLVKDPIPQKNSFLSVPELIERVGFCNSCVVRIYRFALENHLKETECIQWTENYNFPEYFFDAMFGQDLPSSLPTTVEDICCIDLAGKSK